MKIVEMYQCEFCKEVYFSENEAIQCEKFLEEERLLEVGDKVIYEIRVGGGFSPMEVECVVSKVINKGHFFEYTLELIENGDVIDEFVLFGNTSYHDRIKGRK